MEAAWTASSVLSLVARAQNLACHAVVTPHWEPGRQYNKDTLGPTKVSLQHPQMLAEDCAEATGRSLQQHAVVQNLWRLHADTGG